MKTTTFTASAKSAYGQPFSYYKDKDGNPIKTTSSDKHEFEVTAEEFETWEEVVAAKAELSNDDERDAINATRRNNARSEAQQKEWTRLGITKPSMKTDDQLKLKAVYDVLILMPGVTEKEARENASKLLNIQWADKK